MKPIFFPFLAACLIAASLPAWGNPDTPPALDFTIKYYNRVLTPEGVLRESRYDEQAVRRPGHIWTARVLPPHAGQDHEHDVHDHKHFNHVVVPRHVAFDGKQLSVEFIDTHEKYVVNIDPVEYQNVSFDGSWGNAYFVIDPAIIAKLPRSARPSNLPHTHWLEIEKDGTFQRILWDEQRMIPLIAEAGDLKKTFYNRLEITPSPSLRKSLPWENLKGYAQRSYADFLD